MLGIARVPVRPGEFTQVEETAAATTDCVGEEGGRTQGDARTTRRPCAKTNGPHVVLDGGCVLFFDTSNRYPT